MSPLVGFILLVLADHTHWEGADMLRSSETPSSEASLGTLDKCSGKDKKALCVTEKKLEPHGTR